MFEALCDIIQVAGEESRVRIEEEEYLPASRFRRAIDREAEAAIFREREECKRKPSLKFSERRFFMRVVIDNDTFGGTGKCNISK